MRQEVVRFEVNGRRYAVRTLSPDRAVPFGMKVGMIAAPLITGVAMDDYASIVDVLSDVDPDKLTAIVEEARQNLIGVTEEGTDMMLGNPVNFNRWFSEHPEDLYQASLLSVWHVCADFFPPALLTSAKEAGSRIRAARAGTGTA